MNTRTKREALPSARADMEAEAEAQAKSRAADRQAMMAEDFTRTFKTAHGKRVMAWLKQRCGFGEIILSAERQSGGVDPMMTTFAAMELNLYITIRKLLPIELIQEIEDDRSIQPSGTVSSPRSGASVERVTRRRNRE